VASAADRKVSRPPLTLLVLWPGDGATAAAAAAGAAAVAAGDKKLIIINLCRR